jgi:hypothetical protein
MGRKTTTLQGLALIAATLALPVGAIAQQSPTPAGNWQSPGHVTYTNPFLAGDEFSLNIDVAKDGSFRGTWGQYFCMSSIGAMGVAIISCSQSGSDAVTGKFGPGDKGVINLERLGRSEFTWKAPAADELAIDLPQHWKGEDEAVLYRARMSRDGKAKPKYTSATKDSGPPLSAELFYREFKQNSDAALGKYRGTTQVLEGRRGELIPLSWGAVAVNITDGFTVRALNLEFPEPKQLEGIDEGAKFRFKCTVLHFDYQYVRMDNCTVLRE